MSPITCENLGLEDRTMKALRAAVGLAGLGLAGLVSAGPAHATGAALAGSAIFSSYVTNCPDGSAGAGCVNGNASFSVALPTSSAGGSPLGQEFDVTNAEELTGLYLRLSDANPADGGSVLVYLVPNNPSENLPTNSLLSPATLTGASLLKCTFGLASPRKRRERLQFWDVKHRRVGRL